MPVDNECASFADDFAGGGSGVSQSFASWNSSQAARASCEFAQLERRFDGLRLSPFRVNRRRVSGDCFPRIAVLRHTLRDAEKVEDFWTFN